MRLKAYRVRVISYEEKDFNDKDLLSQSAAAALLSVTVQGVQSAVERGRLTLVEDPRASSHHQRRLVLRVEVMQYKWKRRQRIGNE